MKEQIIQEVQRRMLSTLNNEQLIKLRSVLEDTLHGLSISVDEPQSKPEERDPIEAFITAKRIEGCSEKTLTYYWKTIESVVSGVGKNPQQITTDDAQNQKAHLCAFLEHGEIEISNNQVENAIRPFVIGRKGWLFADTPQGAEASAIIYSLMETAKANSLRLDDYLLHLLSILPERAERNKDFEVDDLLPWSEEMKSWFSAV